MNSWTPEECPEAVLVIALGNPERGDHGAPWQVLEGLRTLRPRPGLPRLHLRHARQRTPELAECVSRATAVIFVDTCVEGRPGEVRRSCLSPATGTNPLRTTLGPESLLLYAEALYGRAPRAAVVTIAGASLEEGEQLSPAVRGAVKWAIRAVVRQVQAWAPAPEPAPVASESF